MMHREEFDDMPATELEKKKPNVPVNRGVDEKGERFVISPRAKGICVNCDDAEICKLAGFGGEVVFCEEHSSNFDNAVNDRVSDRIFANGPDLGIKNLLPGLNS